MKTTFQTIGFIFFLLFFLSFQSGATEHRPVWLSNVPPASLKRSVSTYGMHRLCSKKGGRGSRGPVKVIQWIRQGTTVEHSLYLPFPCSADEEVLGFSPKRKKIAAKITAYKGKSVVQYVDNQEGYYNIYLVMKKLSGDTLYVDVAKAELLSHSCRNGHKNVRRAVKPKIYPNTIPFELVRERELNENFHFFIASGDKFVYKPLYKGKTIRGVPVTLSTEKGWKKTERTDKRGEVQFQFIQDYFTHWSELHGRKIYYYLIYSSFTKKESGIYKGQKYRFVHYSTSLSDGYLPSPTMYKSMFWGLAVFVVVLMALVAGIYIYRERRKKPYKETVFDEN